MDNRPQGREKNISGQGKGVKKREQVNTPKAGGNAGVPKPASSGGSSSGGKRSSGGGGLIKLILLAVAVLGGGSLGAGLLGGSGSEDVAVVQETAKPIYEIVQSAPQQSSSAYSGYGGLLEALLGGGYSGTQSSSNLTQGFSYADLFGSSGSSSAAQPSNSGWSYENNTGVLNTKVASAAKEKRTELIGNGKDKVTVMVYMCGTDLESRSSMGTKDLQEMLNAKLGKNVNLLVYTGGCKSWKNNVISSSVNQIYRIQDGKLNCVEKNMGNGSMVKPATLTSFIEYCSENYPANRNFLILWDHGGGSVSGYGYDEKNAGSGSMNLKGLNQALSNAGVSFDFIGFDACLMGNIETALTMAPYADYLIASEETEPGVGWYYTNWLTELGNNSSLSTLELGKKIIDDFVSVCAQTCRGQQTTLSLVDLAELSAVVPASLSDFASSTSELLENDGYATVSNARAGSREFASSEKLDQVDLVHMAKNLGTDESNALAKALLSAVKYNRTSSNMTNAYGLSIYFPYKRTSQTNTAVATFDAVGISSEYTDCIKQFSALQSGGQSVAGSTSPVSSILGGSSVGSGSIGSSDLLTALLSQMLSGGRSVDVDRAAGYLLENSFDASSLFWQDQGYGNALYLSEEQWALVQNLDLNVLVDSGDGYADMGLDNVFEFNEDGSLRGSFDNTWLAINGQEVAYYHIDSTIVDGSYTITGRVPVMLNGSRAELILIFDSENPYGYIAGACFNYAEGETDTVAKLTELNEGDTIDFLCDFYDYNGEFSGTFMIGDQLIYSGSEEISNVYLSEDAVATYRFTDIYANSFWTPAIP